MGSTGFTTTALKYIAARAYQFDVGVSSCDLDYLSLGLSRCEIYV